MMHGKQLKHAGGGGEGGGGGGTGGGGEGEGKEILMKVSRSAKEHTVKMGRKHPSTHLAIKNDPHFLALTSSYMLPMRI